MYLKCRRMIIALLLIVLIFFCGCDLCSKDSQTKITVTIPVKVLRIAAHSAEEEIAELETIGGENWSSIDITVDGGVALEITNKQAEEWLDRFARTMSLLQKSLEKYDSDSKLQINDDYTKIDLFIKKEMTIPDISNYLLNAEALCARYQIFSGTAPDQWYTEINVYNARTGKLVVSGDSNSSLSFYEEDWEASE